MLASRKEDKLSATEGGGLKGEAKDREGGRGGNHILKVFASFKVKNKGVGDGGKGGGRGGEGTIFL